jgi:predicted enzyme related to lactoylglutathione lyase
MSEATATQTEKPAVVNNTWCHVEIPVGDIEGAKTFYGSVFGWNFQDVPGMDYTIYTTPEGGIGGGLTTLQEGQPQQIVNYMNVDSIEATTEALTGNGGHVAVPKTEIPNMGWFSIVTDPSGNAFGLWTGNPNAECAE